MTRHEWPFMSAAHVKRTSLVKVLSEDEPANEAASGIATRDWPQPRSTHPVIEAAEEAAREICRRPLK